MSILPRTVFLLVVPLLVGCTTSLRSGLRETQIGYVQPPKKLICVTNPELTREYKILEWSGIYDFGKLSDCGTPVTLHRLQKTEYPNGSLLSIFEAIGRLGTTLSLGIFPSQYSEAYLLTYEIKEKGVNQVVQYTVYVKGKYSLWEIFRRPFVNEERIFGLALRRQFLLQTFSPKT